MHCPFCRAVDTKVIDSRLVDDGSQVRRRRQCLKCHERVTTFETAELVMPLLIKRDGGRKPYCQQKLRAGLLRALEKRPVSADLVELAIVEIERQIRAIGEREVDSQVVGELVMAELYKLDEVAYVRFASVYKRFAHVDEFSKAIDSLKKECDTP